MWFNFAELVATCATAVHSRIRFVAYRVCPSVRHQAVLALVQVQFLLPVHSVVSRNQRPNTSRGQWTHLWFGRDYNAKRLHKKILRCTTVKFPKGSVSLSTFIFKYLLSLHIIVRELFDNARCMTGFHFRKISM